MMSLRRKSELPRACARAGRAGAVSKRGAHAARIFRWIEAMPGRWFSLDRVDDDLVYVIIEDRAEELTFDASTDTVEEALEFAAGRINDEGWLE